VTAEVRCSGGRTRASGATLRSQLGLYDTWFRVTRATSASGKRAAGVRIPLFAGLLEPRSVTGSFQPAPAAGIVDVEQLEGGRWRLVARGLTNRLGAYSVPVYAAGTYRVSAGGVNADPVVIR
jgi:hypothetical protein